MRISNSFSEGEIQVLEFILQTLLRGGTPSLATRNKDFASVYRKVMTMKKRVDDKKDDKKDDKRSTDSTSPAAVTSTGRIGAASSSATSQGQQDQDEVASRKVG